MAYPSPPGEGQQFPPTNPDVSATKKKKKKKWPWIVAAVVAFLTVISIASNSSKEKAGTAQASDSSPTSTSTSTSSATTSTLSSEQIKAQNDARAAEAERQRQAQEAERQRQAEIAAAKLNPASYETISDRDFALLMKNPDAAKGRKVVLYGVVTQFDSATGTSSFRANTAANPQNRSYDYDQNTVVTGATSLLANVVEKDFVTMYVEIVGSYSYKTTIGGSATVPKVEANIITVTG